MAPDVVQHSVDAKRPGQVFGLCRHGDQCIAGAVRMPLPTRSPVTIPAIAQNPPAKRKPIRATMDSPYPATATRFGRLVLSDAQPAAIRTMALAPWLIPSMKPNAIVESPRNPVM